MTSVIIIFFLVNLYPKSAERIVTKTLSQLEISVNETAKDLIPKKIFSIEYQNLYTASLRMFYDYKITGVGPRMFRYLCVEKKYHIWEGCSSHPHNNYIQLLAETGLIGFIFLIGVFLTLIYSLIKHLFFKFRYQKVIFNDFQLCLLSAILISMWPLIPTGDFFNNWLNIIYFFPVGFFLSSINKNKT